MNKISVLLILLLFFPLCILPVAGATDEIHITYDQTKIDEGKFRYWYGKGVLSTEVSENFCIDTGDANIIAFTGAIPIKKEGHKIDFKSTDDKFETAFLAPVPKGHGLYTVSFELPAISGRGDRAVIIKIENGEKIATSSVNFDTHKEGKYLVLETKTDERVLNFRYYEYACQWVFYTLTLRVRHVTKKRDKRETQYEHLRDEGNNKGSHMLKRERRGLRNFA